MVQLAQFFAHWQPSTRPKLAPKLVGHSITLASSFRAKVGRMTKLRHSLRILAHFARVHGHSPSLALELDPRSLERLTPANHGGSVLRLKSCICTSWTFRDRCPEPPNTSCSPPFESAM